jgi:hypothetical protein
MPVSAKVNPDGGFWTWSASNATFKMGLRSDEKSKKSIGHNDLSIMVHSFPICYDADESIELIRIVIRPVLQHGGLQFSCRESMRLRSGHEDSHCQFIDYRTEKQAWSENCCC